MVDIVPLEPSRAGESEIRGFHEVLVAAQEVDLPDEDPMTYEETANRLRHPFPGFGEVRHWSVRRGGEAVAVATLLFPEHENDHVALALITVHPKSRRQGIGTAVLRALAPEFTARGREVVEGIQVVAGGEAWAATLGFRTVNTTILQHLRFADVDRSLWDVPAPAGYRVEKWVGAAPEDLVASYAEAKHAIGDSPRGGPRSWRPRGPSTGCARPRPETAERGIEQRVVVAVHEPTGEVVGVTEVWLQPSRKPWAYQRDTAVLAAHRGHGLGRAIKAHMLRWLTADRPDLVLAQTGTNADNVHMAGVNHALGFTTVRSMVEVNRTVAGLLGAVVVEPLDPEQAEEAEFAGFHEVVLAAQAVDRPDDAPVTLENLVAKLLNPFAGFGDVRHWLARRDGEVVGAATLMFLSEEENSHLVVAEITVHPKWRRQGIGTAVLRALLPEMTGREVVEGFQVEAGGVGAAWAAALGFRKTNATILQRLRFVDVDPRLWDVPVPRGYRVERWTGSAPEEFVESFALAKTAILDAPRGETAFRQPEWTAERVRAAEAENLRRGVEERVVVAVHESTGAVVGLTQLELNPRRPNWGRQRDTAVLAAHRGRGLGRVVKAAMLRWLVADGPDLRMVYTGTSADNVHMAGVNHALGFTTVRSTIEVNRTVAGLLEALGGVDAEQRQAEHQHP